MKDYVISGIQQIGIGVHDLKLSWEWYRDKFGMDCPIFEEEAEAKLMLPYTGGLPRMRHAVLAFNLQSGGGFEIWQYKGREPQEPKTAPMAGNLGIFACKIKVKNIDRAIHAFSTNGSVNFFTQHLDPEGKKTLFLKDPFGNIFQLVEAYDWFMNERKHTGGSYGAIIGVRDIEKAMKVYSDILGYDEVAYDVKGVFPDLENIPGGDRELRRILLRRSSPLHGPFSKLMGKSEIELISTGDPQEAAIFNGRFWGDPGFIHLCFDIRGMAKLREKCTRNGFPFTVDSEESHDGNSFDMGEAAGHFAYIEDPDGTLIEFVETHKVPILKKFGWYLNLKNRDPHRKLPDWMLKTMRFSKVK
jgi:catechol 2,3-dioxygenase-like lactoylglutathione lyase family enzyme